MTPARERLHLRVLQVLGAAEPAGARVGLIEAALACGRTAPRHRVYGALRYLEVSKSIEIFSDALDARCARLTDKGAVMLQELAPRSRGAQSATPTAQRGARARTRARRVPPATWPPRRR